MLIISSLQTVEGFILNFKTNYYFMDKDHVMSGSAIINSNLSHSLKSMKVVEKLNLEKNLQQLSPLGTNFAVKELMVSKILTCFSILQYLLNKRIYGLKSCFYLSLKIRFFLLYTSNGLFHDLYE